MNFPFMDWILWRKVNCHNFGLYPCDLVQETNLGILHYPSLEMGCVWVLLLLRIKSTALCYCSVTQGNKSQLTEGSMSDSFIAGIVFHAFRLLTCPVCPVSGLIPSLSMVAISISFTGSWVWDCDSSLSLKLVWTVLCLLEIILQAQFTSVFISPLFSLLSKKKKKNTAWQQLFLTPGSNHVSKVQQSSDSTTVTFSTQGLLDYSATTPKVTSASELI